MIIDEIGYTPIERKEANLFFNLISELYEKASVIITSNKRFDEWAKMMGDEVMTVAILDRLPHHYKVFNLRGESFRIQKEEEDYAILFSLGGAKLFSAQGAFLLAIYNTKFGKL